MAFTASTPRLGIINIYDVANASSLGQPGITQLPSVTTEAQFGEIVDGWDPALGGGEFLFARAATTIVAAQTISSITFSTTTATLTTGSAHGLVVGQAITISGAVPTVYNGTYIVQTVPSSTTLTYTLASTPTGNATTVGTYVVGIGAGMVCELAYTLTNGILIITATPWAGTANSAKFLGIAVANLFPGQAGWLQIEGAAITLINGTITNGNPVYWQALGTLSNSAVAGKQVQSATAASVISATINTGGAAVTLASYQALVFVNRPSAQDAIT